MKLFLRRFTSGAATAKQKAPSGNSSDFSQFLLSNKEGYLKAVGEGKGKEWTVVMGNEAGDLDSIASALAYSWFATTVRGAPTVALVQTPRADLKLRPENLYAFALAALDAEQRDLLCIDDVPASSPFPSDTFALVDHNRLGARFTDVNAGARVVAVVDHHADEGLYADGADPRIIEVPTGSCTSLVARLIEQSTPGASLPPSLATLLLCGITVDTGGLKPGGKAESADRAAAVFLAPRVELPPPFALPANADVAALEQTRALRDLADTLLNKKQAVDYLSTGDLLRRDYKEYTWACGWAPARPEVRVGLSTVPLGLKAWLPKDGDTFWADVDAFMDDHNLAVLGILTSFRSAKTGKKGKGKHKRQVLFVVRPQPAAEELEARMWAGLEGSAELRLGRRNIDKYEGRWKQASRVGSRKARAYKQGNVDATRKAIAPLVQAIVEGPEAPAS